MGVVGSCQPYHFAARLRQGRRGPGKYIDLAGGCRCGLLQTRVRKHYVSCHSTAGTWRTLPVSIVGVPPTYLQYNTRAHQSIQDGSEHTQPAKWTWHQDGDVAAVNMGCVRCRVRMLCVFCRVAPVLQPASNPRAPGSSWPQGWPDTRPEAHVASIFIRLSGADTSDVWYA